MSNLGLLHYFLGLEMKQCEGGIFVSQLKYVTDILKKFNMLDCKAAVTPMNTDEKLFLDDGIEKVDASNYRNLVESLIYLTHTRRSVAFAVGVVSQFMQFLTKEHADAAKRILQYITRKSNYGLLYARVLV